MDLLWVCYNMFTLRQLEVPEKMHFFLFPALHDVISKVSILQQLYIILNWPTFQNDQKTHRSLN